MFTKATIVLLCLFVGCETCTMIVFFYQRTVRKLALRLKLEQSVLSFCYPPWLMGMYWATFSKYVIALTLLILDWRCGLIAMGVWSLFFLISISISVPDGFNLIQIYKEVKRRGSKTIGVGVYQFLITEIEKGIVATGGDLEKIKERERDGFKWDGLHKKENLEWTGSRNSNAEVHPQPPVKETAVPQDVVVRTWNTAPASIKSVVVLLTVIGITLLTLGFVTTDEKNVALILPLCLGCCFWLAFWAYQIFKSKNWTRVFAIVLFLLCIGSSIVDILKGGAFDLIAMVGGDSLALVIAALLFCPGANKWFVSWPRGWSLWPILFLFIQAFTWIVVAPVAQHPTTKGEMKHVNRNKTSTAVKLKGNVFLDEVKQKSYDDMSEDELDEEIARINAQLARLGVGRQTSERELTALKVGVPSGSQPVGQEVAEQPAPAARSAKPLSEMSDEELERALRQLTSEEHMERNTVVTRARLQTLESYIMQIKMKTGAYPKDLENARYVYGAQVSSCLYDVWGTKIYYETDGKAFGLSSAGPDKTWATEDDIIIINEGVKQDDVPKRGWRD